MARYIRLHRSKSECQVSEEFRKIQIEISNVIKPHLQRIHPRDLLAAEAIFSHVVQTEMSMERIRRFANMRKK
jgi:hypothetical protein